MMLTRASLIDPMHCPVCAAELSGPSCDSCGAQLSGADGNRLMQLSHQIAGLLDERDVVLGRIRSAPAPGSVPGPVPLPVPVPAVVQVAPPVTVAAPGLFSRLGVHGVLLGVGALLLAVASIGFLAYSWQLIGLPLRAAIIAVITAGVLFGAGRLRATLPDAAEAIGALGVVLVLADAWAVRSTGLMNADQVPAGAYAAGAAAVCALLLGGWFAIFGVRAWSISATVLGPLALVLAGAQFDPPALAGQGLPLGLLAAAALALVRNRLPGGLGLERRVLRIGSAWAIALAVLAALALAGEEPYGWAGAVLVLAGLLTGAQAGPDSGDVRFRLGWSAAAGGVLAVAVAECGQALARSLAVIPAGWVDHRGTAAAALSPWALLPMLFTAVLVTVASVPVVRRMLGRVTSVRPGPAIAGAAAVAGVLAVPAAVQAVAGITGTIAAAVAPAWRFGVSTAVADASHASHGTAISSPRGWLVAVAGLVLLAAWTFASSWLGAPVAIRNLLRWGTLAAAGGTVLVLAMAPWLPLWAAILVLLVAGVLAAPGRGWPLTVLAVSIGVVLSWATEDLSAAVTLFGAGSLLLARRRVNGRTPLASGAVLAAAGSLAGLIAGQAALLRFGMLRQDALLVLALLAAAGVAALIGSPRWLLASGPRRATWTGADRLAAAGPAVLVLLTGCVYWWIRHPGSSQWWAWYRSGPGVDLVAAPEAGWRAPLLTIALIVVLAVAAARPVRQVAQLWPALPVIAAGALVPLTGLLAVQTVRLLDAGLATCFVLALVVSAGGLLITALRLLVPVPEPRRLAVEVSLVLTGLVALVFIGQPAPGSGGTGADLDGRLWLVLLLLGAGAAAIATAPDRTRVRWLAGLLIAGSSWARLAASGVTLVEAYTLPPAAVLLALSLWQIRRTPSSAPRLLTQVATLALTPSILVSWSGSGLRPALLLVAAGALASVAMLARHRDHRIGAALAGVAALAAGSTALVRVLGGADELRYVSLVPLGSVEVWTLPAAAVLLAVGLRFGGVLPGRFESHPEVAAASWFETGPGLAFLLLPSLFVLIGNGAGEAGPVRIALLTVLAGATLYLGAVRRMQAPVLFGAGVLVLDALVHLLPWIVRADVPPWVGLAVVGLLLVLLGATYEKRLRQIKDLRLLIAALH